MRDMHLTLPEPVVDWIDAQVSSGRCTDTSSYFIELIRQDQAYQEARQALMRELEIGEASGISDVTVAGIWETVKGRQHIDG